MFAKWIIAVILGLSSVLATDARAKTFAEIPNPSNHLSILADEVQRNTRIPVDLKSYTWIAQENPRRVESILENLKIDGAGEIIQQFSEKCRVHSVNEIAVGSSTFITDNGKLVLDHELTHPLNTLKIKTSDCERTYDSFDKAQQALNPERELIVSSFDVVMGQVKGSNIAAWSAELRSNAFSEAIALFEASCRQPVSKIAVTSLTNYDKISSKLNVSFKKSPRAVRSLILAAAKSCAQLMEPLVTLNEKFAVDRGVLFYFDVNDLLEKKFRVADALKWMRFFSASSARVSKLYAAVIEKARSAEPRAFKSCDPNCQLFMNVKLGGDEYFMEPGILESMVTIFTFVAVPYSIFIDGSSDSSALELRLSEKYNAVLNSTISLNVGTAPHVPRF